MQPMQVDIINLGNGPRVFHDRRNLPVVVGVGKIVQADMPESVIRSINSPGETVVIAGAGEGKIPQHIQEIVNLLAVLAFEEYATLTRRFHSLVPIHDSTQMRPNRQQMRVALTNEVEDYVRAQVQAARRPVRDDVDPAELEREQAEEQTRRAPPPPVREPEPDPPVQQHALRLAAAPTPAPVFVPPAHERTGKPKTAASKPGRNRQRSR